jgi:hypothetical protein
MSISAHLNGSIGRLIGLRTRWEGDLRKEAKGRDGDLGERLGGEAFFPEYHFLDFSVGGLFPKWSQRCHCSSVARLLLLLAWSAEAFVLLKLLIANVNFWLNLEGPAKST